MCDGKGGDSILFFSRECRETFCFETNMAKSATVNIRIYMTLLPTTSKLVLLMCLPHKPQQSCSVMCDLFEIDWVF